MAGIVQQHQRSLMVGLDLDRCDVADFEMVRRRRNRALVGLQHLDRYPGTVGQQRAAPAPGPNAEIGVSAISGAPSGRIGPLTERL